MDTLTDIISFFLSETASDTPQTNKNYSKAVSSFNRFVQSVDTCQLSEPLLILWLSHLLRLGYSYKVISYYLKIISSLYNRGVKLGKFPPSDIFIKTKEKLREIESLDFDFKQREEDFAKLQSLAKNTSRNTGVSAITTDILLTSVLSLKNPEIIGKLKKEDTASFIPELTEIFERNISPKRKYVFDFNQSHRTDRQLARILNESITNLLILKGFSRQLPINDIITNLWAFAALRCGVNPARIIGCLGHRPADNPLFAFCEAESLNDEDKSTILSSVAKSILVNPQEWFVMRLRPGVKYKTIEQQIATLNPPSIRPRLFYPCDEIRKRINKKVVYELKPIIPDIVFFKTRQTDVLPLFRLIGDKAWCYTAEGDGGKYAVIPQKAMQSFQEAIGKFSSDYEVGPIGSITPKKGDRIAIIGGMFSGQEGIVERIEGAADDCNTIYRIKFPDQQGFEWRVNVDSRLVRQAIS